jgi:hypothetical protein
MHPNEELLRREYGARARLDTDDLSMDSIFASR